MENSNRSNENAFVDFFKGLDENYQRHLIDEMKHKQSNKPAEEKKK